MTAFFLAIGVCAAVAPWMIRMLWGPTAFDRVLSGHVLWTAAALVAACLGVALKLGALLDAALAFALTDAVLVLVAIKAARRNSFQPALAPLDEGAP